MTSPAPKPETWLRGPVAGVPLPLQPVAHALLQALEDAERLTAELGPDDLWTSPGGAATIAFHLRHAAGSLDRLLTYARGSPLDEEQRRFLSEEQQHDPSLSAEELLLRLRETVERSLEQLRTTPADVLDEHRPVGRAAYPSSVRGLLYHAGEHTARHMGQIATTARIVRGLRSEGSD